MDFSKFSSVSTLYEAKIVPASVANTKALTSPLPPPPLFALVSVGRFEEGGLDDDLLGGEGAPRSPPGCDEDDGGVENFLFAN